MGGVDSVMVLFAQPAHLQRLRVVVVVGLHLGRAAHLAWFPYQGPALEREAHNFPSRVPRLNLFELAVITHVSSCAQTVPGKALGVLITASEKDRIVGWPALTTDVAVAAGRRSIPMERLSRFHEVTSRAPAHRALGSGPSLSLHRVRRPNAARPTQRFEGVLITRLAPQLKAVLEGPATIEVRQRLFDPAFRAGLHSANYITVQDGVAA